MFLSRFKQQPREKQIRAPMTKHLLSLVLMDTSIDIAVRTALVFAFNNALRVSEYTSTHRTGGVTEFQLQRRHVRWDADINGFAAHLPRSKSDHCNAGSDIYFISRGDDLCPVRWLRQYLQAGVHTIHGSTQPLFILQSGGFVTRADIDSALKRHAPSAGLPADRISSHSVRIGAIFAMANAGVSWVSIQALARWSATSAPAMSLLYARMSLGRLCTATTSLAHTFGQAEDPPLLSNYRAHSGSISSK
jgi:hypothetical protein